MIDETQIEASFCQAISTPLFRKNTTGAARSREQPLDGWPMVPHEEF